MFLRVALWLILMACPLPVLAAEMIDGPYRGEVQHVVDGDTLAVRVTVWLQQDIQVLVRIRGIDTPELRGECAAEKALAEAAKAELARLVASGPVVLVRIEGDKYYGRVLADVTTAASVDVARALLASGVARPYMGGRRGDWCGIAERDAKPPKLAQAGPLPPP